MPVPPSSSAVGSRYSSYSSYSSYRNPSSSAYLGRTTSLDRSPYTGSGYASTYSSSYSSKYALPPRPTYSTSSDTYRSSRSLRQSPVRSSYSRLNSDSETAPSTSRYGSRYTRDSTRESSTSRDSGYGSRLTSRDRSVDLVNGNSLDTSHFGPSPSSYACNYRWEIRERDKNGDDDTSAQNGESEKVHISDRIRAFETRTPDSLVGLPAGRESSASSRDTIPSGSSRYLSARDSSSVRRRPYGASADTHSRSPSASKASPLAARKDTPETSSKKGSVEDRRPSVTELCRKYDSNHNVTNGLSRQDEDSDGSQSSGEAARQAYESSSTSAAPTTISSRRRTDSTSHGERTDSPTSTTLRVDSPNRSSRVESPARGRVESPITVHKESPARTRVDSPTRTQHESPSRKPIESYSDRDGRSSPLVNGILDKPKVRVEVDGYEGTRSRYRRDRVRERIAARLAKEGGNKYKISSPMKELPEQEDLNFDKEDDIVYGVPAEEDGPRRYQSSNSSSSSCSGLASGVLSENNGLVGLRNIGNTCFMNSVTQCLSNTRFLLEYLVRDGFTSDINTTISTMKGDLVKAFANLMSDMWSEGGDTSRALNTGPFKSQIQRFAPAFSGYQQHDAQEFLRKLLEGLHEDVNRVTAKPRPITEDIDDDLDDTQKAMESWKRYLRYDDSKIVDMFVGQLKSCLQCSICGHCSVTFDPFWDLSLPIPSKSGQVRLTQCLDLFTKEEVLDGDERPTCSKCKERRKMTKSFSIQKFPKVLVLHLKRFSPLERWRGKLSCTVEFPLETLDLSKFASSSSTSPFYNLIGVANHSGTTYSGHYTAYCKHPYSGTWHEYNDSRVSNISTSRVCSPEAYVLFYEMASTSSKL